MILWVCAGVLVLSAFLAAVMSDVRSATLWLWVAGLGAGGVYLSVGAELLAVIQWIVATVVAIGFVFYSVMFGEFGSQAREKPVRQLIQSVLPIGVGLIFEGMLWLGSGPGFLGMPMIQGVPQAQDLSGTGRVLARDHLLSVEILGLILLLLVVGSGVIARPDVVSEGTPEGGDGVV
jgi:NADH:ubiquinone oxidoreductase subunit 6 (subunit J)